MNTHTVVIEQTPQEQTQVPLQSELGIISPSLQWYTEKHPLSPGLALYGLGKMAEGMKDYQIPSFNDRMFAEKSFSLFRDKTEKCEVPEKQGIYYFAARIAATIGDLAIASIRGIQPSFSLPYFRNEAQERLSADSKSISLAAKQAAMVLLHARVDGAPELLTGTASWSRKLAVANIKLRAKGEPAVLVRPSWLLTRSSARGAFLGLAISSIDELSGTLK
jgi:hypothetical protein